MVLCSVKIENTLQTRWRKSNFALGMENILYRQCDGQTVFLHVFYFCIVHTLRSYHFRGPIFA